jgi:hypothetical protein
LNVWIPATTGLDLRVRNIVSEAGPFGTDIACCCHSGTPFYFSIDLVPMGTERKGTPWAGFNANSRLLREFQGI